MTITLDQLQRLNLIGVLGLCDVKGRDLHALWHLQDLLELDAKEKEEIEFRQQSVNGQLVIAWNDSKVIPPREFQISEADIERIRKAIEEFPQFRSSRDRVWLEPLLAQMPAANGQKG